MIRNVISLNELKTLSSQEKVLVALADVVVVITKSAKK
jgi:hypothetical protein